MKKIRIIRSGWDDESDRDFYSEGDREELLENGELSPIEEAFMKGWEEAE
ncbi:MAG: hypothetical protein KAU20_03365 [Nanoarchaeota archaeon]|nr:hypothetical protein [Nanoarchaeota archaeon]